MNGSTTQVAPAKAPDLTGPYGRAWKISHADSDSRPDYAASLGAWLVEQPTGHPARAFHSVGVIHLRPIAGVQPAVLLFPEATHEFLCMALDPTKPLPEVEHWQEAAFLMPPDLAHQVALPADEQAAEVCELAVKYAITGGLPLDDDVRAQWASILSKTAEHYRPGGHG